MSNSYKRLFNISTYMCYTHIYIHILLNILSIRKIHLTETIAFSSNKHKVPFRVSTTSKLKLIGSISISMLNTNIVNKTLRTQNRQFFIHFDFIHSRPGYPSCCLFLRRMLGLSHVNFAYFQPQTVI